MFDIIGDVHGEVVLLKKLLKELGYAKTAAGFSNPGRKAVFVGDFINRGPEIWQTLKIIRQMTDEGNALAILGNHEINAILYYLKNEKKESLLSIIGKRFESVSQTIAEFRNNPREWKDYRKWFRSLPLFLEIDGIRVVHACWKDSNIQYIRDNLPAGKIPKSIFRNLVLDHRSEMSQSILQTTRGIHHIMPPDLRIFDNRHRNHHFYRIRWWKEPHGLTFHEWSFESKFQLPNYTIPVEIIPEVEAYPENDPIVFFGHYCRGNGPFIIRENLCCVDACVTGTKRLAAYRWDGEKTLDEGKMVFVK
jgi:Calcineurin-like phosphoesterase